MSRRMKVAVDARMIAHSGIGTVLRGLLQHWALEPPPFSLRVLGPVEVLLNHAPPAFEADFMRFDAPLYGLRALLAHPPVHGCSALYIPHYNCPLWPRVPLAVTVHDLVHITHPPSHATSPYMRILLRVLSRRANVILTDSRHTKVQLQTLHGQQAHRVLTVPPGPGIVGLESPSELPSGVELPPRFLLSIGIWKAHKNWDFLLRRFAALPKTRGIELPLVIAGLNPAGREQLPARAEALGISSRLVILPRLTDGAMISVIQRAQALLFPSLVEGFGLPIVEAMSLGVPVVAADLAPMNEVGGTAIVPFDPDYEETFDAAVERALGHLNRGDIIARGREQAAKYSWRRMARGVEEAVLRAVEEGKR